MIRSEGMLGGHSADDLAFPHEVAGPQLAQGASQAGQDAGAGRGAELAEPDPARARAAGQFPER